MKTDIEVTESDVRNASVAHQSAFARWALHDLRGCKTANTRDAHRKESARLEGLRIKAHDHWQRLQNLWLQQREPV